MSTSNPYASKRKVELEVSGDVQSHPEPVAIEVPAGSVSEVLAWVGADLERAQAALDAEKAGHARKTLVAKLTDVLDGADR